MEINGLIAKLWNLITVFGVKLLAAIAVFIMGRWVAIVLKELIQKGMRKADVDETLTSFIVNLAYIALMTIVVIAALGQLGVQTTSFVAILGAAGLAVGLALQSSLSNFASGVMMIFFRPIKVGDLIEGAGVSGVVREIQIFNTILLTTDNRTVIVPNAKITADKIINYSTQGTRCVEMMFTIGYRDNLDTAKKVIAEVMENDSRILKDPKPLIAVAELVGNSNMKLAVRPWTKADDYWDVWFDITEKIKKSFDANGINARTPMPVLIQKEE